ncbi:hypothetical protein [Rahnella sp. EDr1-12]|uniref:hypothetical protein n=1 Tax=unclassified Rahnella TaxID=2635087 RepID=UPI003BA9610C
MSISNDIWQSIQNGDLEPFCQSGFPQEQVFLFNFWDFYVLSGNAEWEDYRPALNVLVDQALLIVSANGWYNFA